jgi:SAM-dependent methyltransferase
MGKVGDKVGGVASVAVGSPWHDCCVHDVDEADRLYAWLYDAGEVGWPGEIEFYRRAAEASGEQPTVVDVACGTGRIALALAELGLPVTGTDLSPGMIEVARSKTVGRNPRWVVSDMRRLAVVGTFSYAIVGGHAFQFMATERDAVAALRAIQRHLDPGGRVTLHIDNPGAEWLAGLPDTPGEPRPADDVRLHPLSGDRWRKASCWSQDRGRRDAILSWCWQRLDQGNRVVDEVAEPGMRLHVFVPEEVERAVAMAGLATVAVHGDFDASPFTTTSPSLLWVAQAP